MYKIINRKKLIATVAADMLGRALLAPVNFFQSREEISPGTVREILVVRTAYIGDVIMTLPILKPLKERFPGARITFLTSSSAKDVLKNNPFIDDIITYDAFWFYPVGKAEYFKFRSQLRKRHFDLVIEARADIRDISLVVWPATARFKVSYDVGGGAYLLTHVVPYKGLKHKVQYHLDLARYLGCTASGMEWGMYLSRDEKEHAKKILQDNGVTGSFICAHPGARLSLKRWPVDRCSELYDRIIDDFRVPLVLLGTEGEMAMLSAISMKMNHDPVVLKDGIDLRSLAGIIAESELLICNDSAPMHIAASMGTPTVAIFGPSKSIETSPYGNISQVVEKEFACRRSCDEHSCRHHRFHACMSDIEVEDVYSAVKALWGER